jgi:hypothetical protein
MLGYATEHLFIVREEVLQPLLARAVRQWRRRPSEPPLPPCRRKPRECLFVCSASHCLRTAVRQPWSTFTVDEIPEHRGARGTTTRLREAPGPT